MDTVRSDFGVLYPCPPLLYLPFLRGLPASLRFPRHEPSALRLRGCLPPPSSRTYGPLPALRSAIFSTSFHYGVASGLPLGYTCNTVE